MRWCCFDCFPWWLVVLNSLWYFYLHLLTSLKSSCVEFNGVLSCVSSLYIHNSVRIYVSVLIVHTSWFPQETRVSEGRNLVGEVIGTVSTARALELGASGVCLLILWTPQLVALGNHLTSLSHPSNPCYKDESFLFRWPAQSTSPKQ